MEFTELFFIVRDLIVDSNVVKAIILFGAFTWYEWTH